MWLTASSQAARSIPASGCARLIVVDELAALKRQGATRKPSSRGRKRELSGGGRFQTISQLRASSMAQQGERAVLDAFDQAPAFRVDEPETAQFLSQQIGERETTRDHSVANAGEFSNSLTLHTGPPHRPLVLPVRNPGTSEVEPATSASSGCDRHG